MARLGALKPLRGTISSLANIVLQEGELAFTYPTTGPGTGYGGIKMGDGTSKFSKLDWYITPEDYWEDYDEGTNEAALLHNITHAYAEKLGKIYYIQSYMNAGTELQEGTPTIQQNIPYRVIGINHDSTTNTVDLMSCVAVNYLKWNDSYTSSTYGMYTVSKQYNWLPNTCANGYSTNIQAKMVSMTERWRQATGDNTGILYTRSTKVKLLNPVELFGSSAASYTVSWTYGSSSDHMTKFLSEDYGTQYPIWDNSIGSLTSRTVYHDKAMSRASIYWTNSWFAFQPSNGYAYCFNVGAGSCNYSSLHSALGIAPVIRLQG